MPPLAELPPVTDERRLAIAQWVETNVRPVLHVVAEDAQALEQPQQEFELRDYQVDAWANLDIAREEGRTRALGNLATGLGKTFVAAVDVMRYREWCAAQDPPMYPRILYVSHQRDINVQAAKTFGAIMPDAEIAFFETRQEQLPDADITFANIQGLYSELSRFDPQDYEYIVWDESHHLEAETYKAVRDYFDPLFEHAITATVERMDGKDIQDYFGPPLYQKSLPEGIAEGHLADVDYHIVFDKTIRQKLKDGFNPKTLGQIKKLFKDKPPIEEIAKSIEEEIERLGLVNPKIIAFCESIEETEALATELGGAAYHSGATDRPQTLSNFRSGQLRRITTRDMFNEGVDIPDADLLVFLRGTGSPTIFEQQLGRGLRRAPGKTKVYVLDYVANIERIAKVRELSESIQRRARQLSQRDGAEEGVVPDEINGEGGLHVHTAHGDFDFDRIAIDLLEKFGTLRRAGLNTEILGMTNDELVALALRLKPGAPLSYPEIDQLSRERNFLSTPTIKSRFGSVAAFYEACGFTLTDKDTISNEALVAIALDLSPDAPLSQDRINELSKQGKFFGSALIASRFSSLGAFHRACGFDVFDPRTMTNDEIVALALKLKPDGVLTTGEIDKLSRARQFISYPTIKERFGSLAAFREACGVAPAEPKVERKIDARSVTDEELIALALTLKPAGPITAQEIIALSAAGEFVGQRVIQGRFGSLRAFQEACGFAPVRQNTLKPAAMTNQDIIDLALSLKSNGPLSTREIVELSKQGHFVSNKLIANRFGSMGDFHRACGFDPHDPRRT